MSRRPEALRVQFDEIGQQKQADVLGMWIFLVTEVLFFGGLFLVYAVSRWSHPQAFLDGSDLLNQTLGTLNTAILLTSSLTMALADHGAKRRNRKLVRWMLSATLVLGLAFLVIKGFEYHLEFRHDRIPFIGDSFRWPGDDAAQGRLFFNVYFAMTGLHALHLFIGLGVLGAMLWLAGRARHPDRLVGTAVVVERVAVRINAIRGCKWSSGGTNSLWPTWYSVYTSYNSFDASSPVWSVGNSSRAFYCLGCASFQRTEVRLLLICKTRYRWMASPYRTKTSQRPFGH